MTRRVISEEKRRSPARYTPEEVKWLEERYGSMSVNELVEAHNKEFSGNPITKWQLYRINYSHDWKPKQETHRNKPIWSDEMIVYCRKHATEYSYREMAAVLTKEFGKPIREEQITSMYARKGITNNKPTAFHKGHTPFNKGLKWDEYLTEEQKQKQLKTCFKKGNIPHGWKPIGTIAVRRDKHDGREKYRWIKVTDKNNFHNYILYSRYIYEKEHNVKLKDDELVLHLDGNSLNDSIENLYIVTNKENAVLNRYYKGIKDNPELKLASVLTVRTKNKVKELTDDKNSGSTR